MINFKNKYHFIYSTIHFISLHITSYHFISRNLTFPKTQTQNPEIKMVATLSLAVAFEEYANIMRLYIDGKGSIEFILATFTPTYRKSLVYVLSTCNCCERHQLNRPTVYGPLPHYPPTYSQCTHECQCICRNFSRFICRSYNNEQVEQVQNDNQDD